jgi:outer membrane protein TolC
MKTAASVLALALLAAACRGAALPADVPAGGMTPFARRALAGETSVPVATHPEPTGAAHDAATQAKLQADLEKLAERFRETARKAPADPSALGFDVGHGVDEARLKQDLTPAVVLGAAFSMSPDVRAAKDAFRATVEQFSQVAFLDSILRQYTSFTKDLDLRIGTPRQKEMVTSFFPFPGTLALKSHIVEDDAKAAQAHLQGVVRRTLVATGRAYEDYAYAREAIGIVKENIEILRGMVQVAQSKYGVGKARQGIVLRTHTEIATLEDRLVTLQQRLQTTRARVASLLGLPADFPLGAATLTAPSAPPAKVAPLQARARTARQEIQGLDARIARTEALIELVETQAYPDLSLGYSRFEEGAGTRVGGARMKAPFADKPTAKPKPWFGQTASFVQEMRRRLESMKSKRASLLARVDYEVKDAWFKWDAAWREAALHRTSLLPRAQQAYQVLQSGWKEGLSDFLDALDAQRTWLKVRLEERAAVRDALSGRFALLDAVGSDLGPAAPKKNH